MGFQTDLFTTLTFNHQTFNSRYDVNDELNETEKLIKYYENKLYSIGVMTEPKKYCDDDDDPIAFINSEINDSLKELDDLYVERFKLQLVLETWNQSHDEDGFAIPVPNNVPWNAAYIDGDFIKHKENE